MGQICGDKAQNGSLCLRENMDLTFGADALVLFLFFFVQMKNGHMYSMNRLEPTF